MKLKNKLLAVLCLALIACLAAPAVLPGSFGAVVCAQAASKVKLNKTKATLYNGQKLTLKVKGAKKTVKWSTSDAKVAKVSKKGVVTAKAVGTATITAKVGKQKLTCKLTVKAPLKASATKVTLDPGKSKKVTLTWQLQGKVYVKWDNASVVKCKFGKQWKDKKNTLTIQAIGPGTATITLINNKTRDVVEIKVTVRDSGKPVPVVDKTDLALKVGETANVKVTKTWQEDALPYVKWTWEGYGGDVISCKFGKSWEGNSINLGITALDVGTGEVVITKGEGGPEMAKINVTVK